MNLHFMCKIQYNCKKKLAYPDIRAIIRININNSEVGIYA